MTVALVSLGRPGTRGDRRAVALGLRSKGCAQVVEEFLNEIEPLRADCRLTMPSLSKYSIELPEELEARFFSARPDHQ